MANSDVNREPRGLMFLELIPLAWLAAVAFSYGALALTPIGEDRAAVPGIGVIEEAVVPLLCLMGAAGILRVACLRLGRAPLTAARGEGQDTL